MALNYGHDVTSASPPVPAIKGQYEDSIFKTKQISATDVYG